MSEMKKPMMIALYLPQYYETEYNNEWWGKGYTEWVACKKAKPLYRGHLQPRKPFGNNYYDLSKVETIYWQINMAKEYGLDGFAIYQYYSCGKKLLEIPTEMFRDDFSIDFPFFLYWANESWRKAWFGQNETIVWEQKYGNEKDWRAQFEYCLRYFKRDNYIKIDNKPVYAIYNPWHIPDVDLFIKLWNQLAKDNGFNGIFFIKTLTRRDSQELGSFSATVTREPNYTFAHDECLWEKVFRVLKSRFYKYTNKYILMPIGKGVVMNKVSYDKVWSKILSRDVFSMHTCLGAFCDWDNSPRKQYNSIIMDGASPVKFHNYLKKLYEKAMNIGSPMVVINAWNEWAEGAYLEPDERNQYGFLEAIKKIKEDSRLK